MVIHTSNKGQITSIFCQVEILQSANITRGGVLTRLKVRKNAKGYMSRAEFFFLMEYNRKGLMAAGN